MVLPKLGLGLVLVRRLSQTEWGKTKEELEKLLADYGYNVKDWPYDGREKIRGGTEETETLSFGRKVKSLAETIGLEILGEPKIGMLLSEIRVNYYFEHKQSNVPLRIELAPSHMGQSFTKEKYSMPVIEKTEPILTKNGFFKVFYKCSWENWNIKAFEIDCRKECIG